MKIIFLDIDGVMNSKRYFRSIDMKKNNWDRFDPISVNLIKQLVEEFEAKIVISSSWRFGAKDLLFNELTKSGLLKYLHKDWKTPYMYGYKRGDEIMNWLENHKGIKKYIIIDDEANILEDQTSIFVNTNMDLGFNEECFKKAQKILRSL